MPVKLSSVVSNKSEQSLTPPASVTPPKPPEPKVVPNPKSVAPLTTRADHVRKP